MGVPELDFFLGHALADHSNERQVAIDAADLSPAMIESLAARATDEEQVGLSSSCRLRDGTVAHIPMLDYRLPPHPTAINRVRRVLGALQQKESVIVASGRSFHSWGMDVVRRELEQKGVRIVHETDWTLYIRDPEGNRIGLSHHPEDRPSTSGI